MQTRNFPLQEIINAIGIMSHGGSATDCENANKIIMEWANSSYSLIQSLQIVSECNDETIVLGACSVALKCIIESWTQCQPNIRKNIRDTLCGRLLGFECSPVTKSKIIELIVAIALKDWPEEWPDCLDSFINSAATSPELCVLDFKILAQLITQIHETDTITNQRRKQLIEEFNKNTSNLLGMTNWAIGNIDFNLVGLDMITCIKALCLTSPKELLIIPGFVPTLFNTFVLNELTSNVAIDAAINLFINRPDSHEIVKELLDQIIEIASNIIENGYPPSFPFFLIQFITEYGVSIEEMCYGEEDNIDEELINWTLTIYRVILQNPPTETHCEEFWHLWRSILYRYFRASKSKNQFDALQPCLLLYKNLIPEIRESLYTSFTSAGEGGKLKSINCQACWIFLTAIDKRGMIEFLLSIQQITPSLCYAFGLLDACLNNQEEHELLLGILPKLFQYQQNSKSIEFGVSLLYALSHSIRFLNQEIQFLTVFGSCLYHFLESEDLTVRSSSVNALYYVSIRQPLLLCKEPEPIFGMLTGKLPEWIVKFDVKHSIKLAKVIVNVGSAQINDYNSAEVYNSLTHIILQMTQSGNIQLVVNALQIMNEITKIKLNRKEIVFSQFVDIIIPLLQTILVNSEAYFSQLTETMTSVINTFEFEVIKQIIDQFVGLLLQQPQFKEVSLIIFSRLRKYFVQMEVFYQMIQDQFVQPLLPNLAQTRVEVYPILKFSRAFNRRPETVGILLEISAYFITDERLNVAKESSKMLRTLILDYYEAQNINEIVNCRMQIMQAIFTALTDTFHTPIFNSLAKALNAFFKTITSSTYPPQQFDNDVVTLLKNLTNDMNMLRNFSGYLRFNVLDFKQFAQGLRDFLIAVKCASNSDKYLFKQEIKMDNLTEELMSIVSAEERDAIKAEEIEALPDLAQLALQVAKF
ncbi:hypothetical protein GPJ56_006185 [Histomonas meleagridis]|uniref:uncharacterized protein n=1 Tax=Histomonas meleagridis TaxID=135588 RepID=UPI00355AA309|nr:hypothetical protein GPJ56_006185 [Histomonas meleagridis]KAH0796999.1 hypothetical protein GO595_010892 [Histomonas meleagridis]